jgi:hypothetical protein
MVSSTSQPLLHEDPKWQIERRLANRLLEQFCLQVMTARTGDQATSGRQ